ncbi:MAG: caspase family protein [Pseudomonadota bacterium]
MRFGLLSVLMIPLLCTGHLANAEPNSRRIALVIGNGDYVHAGVLANPANDAADIAQALDRVGFEVIKGLNLTKAQMDATIRRFARALQTAEVGLFFYAGHGIQVSGKNYLVPVDAKLEDVSGIDFELIQADLIQRTMERAAQTNIIFLDACRNNPLARNLARAMGTRSVAIGRGLASASSGLGTLISFSTQPNNVALDGTGRNSPYAAALKQHLLTPGDNISEILVKVRRDVIRATARRQVPWEHVALTDELVFVPATPGPSPEEVAENALWDIVRNTNRPGVLEAFLDRYPDGQYSEQATVQLKSLLQKQRQRRRENEERLARQRREAAGESKARERRLLETQARQSAEIERMRAMLDELRTREGAARNGTGSPSSQQQSDRPNEKTNAEVRKQIAELKQTIDQMRSTNAELANVRAQLQETAKRSRIGAHKIPRTERPSTGVRKDDAPPDGSTSVTDGNGETAEKRTAKARTLQRELRRVGCYRGKLDGDWGPQSKRAMMQFNRSSGLSLPSGAPTPAAIQQVSAARNRVCAATVAATRPAGKKKSSNRSLSKPRTTRSPARPKPRYALSSEPPAGTLRYGSCVNVRVSKYICSSGYQRVCGARSRSSNRSRSCR